jgi:phosphopantothenoylcysteine decarboxylase / phosphopantothenate---cysteine ligase
MGYNGQPQWARGVACCPEIPQVIKALIKRILLGVTGSIAAYKAAELVRLLARKGLEVRVMMTPAAGRFVTPLTFQALSGQPVATDLLDGNQEAAMGHIALARWADLVLIAPASANCLARLAAGIADDLVSATCLATGAPLLVAPAMNSGMWTHPATQANLRTLAGRGVRLLGPTSGELACGESGPGRMLEAREILSALQPLLRPGPLALRRVLITAGPTREPIDPVRYISNRSSGKMGFALAEALRDAGAEVTLVAGPVALETPAGVQRIAVETARQMYDAVLAELERQRPDLFVACAAVADFRPATVAGEKIKKADAKQQLELELNPDILATVAALPADRRPFCVGFAAETGALLPLAEEKRRRKGVDLLAANRVGAAEGGFEADDNAFSVIWAGGGKDLPMMPKRQLAVQLCQLIVERLHETG